MQVEELHPLKVYPFSFANMYWRGVFFFVNHSNYFAGMRRNAGSRVVLQRCSFTPITLMQPTRLTTTKAGEINGRE